LKQKQSCSSAAAAAAAAAAAVAAVQHPHTSNNGTEVIKQNRIWVLVFYLGVAVETWSLR
jgi:alpha/beta superfamily hydrolase